MKDRCFFNKFLIFMLFMSFIEALYQFKLFLIYVMVYMKKMFLGDVGSACHRISSNPFRSIFIIKRSKVMDFDSFIKRV